MLDMKNYESIMKSIVKQQGGNREKEIFKQPYTLEQGETWNEQHKVINIISIEAEEDGYRNGFQVDIVRQNICG